MSILRWVVLVVALITPPVSTTLAHIDPPDPTSIGGYWDDDDFDSAVEAILQVAAVVSELAPGDEPVRWMPVGRIERLDVNLVAPKKTLTTESPRSPPVSLLPSSV